MNFILNLIMKSMEMRFKRCSSGLVRGEVAYAKCAGNNL